MLSKQICKISTSIYPTNSFEAGEHEDAIEASHISTFDCYGRKRYFKTKRGLTLHQRSCKGNPKNVEQSVTSTIDFSHDDRNSEGKDTVFKWGDIDGTTFIERLELIYEKVVYWKKNLFLLPTGKSGKLYIDESVKLLNSWVEGTALHNITFKAIMNMPNLLLQKPSKNSKAKDNLTTFERRMQSWLKGDLMELLDEGETIQKNLAHQLPKGDMGKIPKKLAALMRKGNANAAINLLTEYEKRNITREQRNIEPSPTETSEPKRCLSHPKDARNVIRRSGKNTHSKI